MWGLGYRFTHDVVRQLATVRVPPVAALDHSLVSGFAQDEIALRKECLLTLGTKLEHNDYTGFEFGADRAPSVELTPKQIVWAAVSRAVRTPIRASIATSAPSQFPIILVGSDDFESETLDRVRAWVSRRMIGSRFSASISAFYNDYDHLRSLSFTPDHVIPLFFEQRPEGETHGVELSATYQASRGGACARDSNVLKERLHVQAGRDRHQPRIERDRRPRAPVVAAFVVRSAAATSSSTSVLAGLTSSTTTMAACSERCRAIPTWTLRLGWPPRQLGFRSSGRTSPRSSPGIRCSGLDTRGHSPLGVRQGDVALLASRCEAARRATGATRLVSSRARAHSRLRGTWARRHRRRYRSREYQVKAVFLFNFAQFVDWPVSAFAEESTPLMICVLGDDPFGTYLDDLVRGEQVNNRRLTVQRFRTPEDAKGCQVLFVSRSESGNLTKALASGREMNALTVSDVDGFAAQGGIIQLTTESGKIRLKINVIAAKALNLVISSKLLRSAEIVGGKDD